MGEVIEHLDETIPQWSANGQRYVTTRRDALRIFERSQIYDYDSRNRNLKQTEPKVSPHLPTGAATKFLIRR
jgi:hypothetical protein